ncbi:MAG: hypothetical protein QUS08_04205 [Methanothrix sp.]|nr:hypothetical protein [Methanothrix sp.]
MKRLICLTLLMIVVPSSVAVPYKKTAGPWIVEFNASAGYNTRNHYEPPNQEGYSWWQMFLIDPVGHEVAWFSFRSYANPQKASEDFLDEMLDWATNLFKVTSPTKTSVTVDQTDGRMAEGYASEFNRKWRGVIYPYRSTYDSFTGTNTTKHFIGFNSLQDQPEFEAIVQSMHVTNVTNM